MCSWTSRSRTPKWCCFRAKRLEIYYPKINTVDEYDLTKEYKLTAQQFLLLGFGSNSAELKSAYTVSLGGPVDGGGSEGHPAVPAPQE